MIFLLDVENVKFFMISLIWLTWMTHFVLKIHFIYIFFLCFSFPQVLAIYCYRIIAMVLTIIKPPMREKTHVCCVDLNTLVMQSNILCNVRNYEMSENKQHKFKILQLWTLWRIYALVFIYHLIFLIFWWKNTL